MKRTALVAASLCALTSAAFAGSFTENWDSMTLGSNGASGGWARNISSTSVISDTRSTSAPHSLRFSTTGTGTDSHARLLSLISAETFISASTQLYLETPVAGMAGSINRFGALSFSSSSTIGNSVLGISISNGGVVRAGTTYNNLWQGTGLATLTGFADKWLTLSLTFDRTTGAGTVGITGADTNFSANFTAANTMTQLVLADDWSTSANASANNMYFDDVVYTAVPEPATMTVLGLGALAAFLKRRSK
jgi:hypothetical protein